MVVLPPQGASDTYVQLPDIGADTIRAPRYGFARVSFTVKRMGTTSIAGENQLVLDPYPT